MKLSKASKEDIKTLVSCGRIDEMLWAALEEYFWAYAILHPDAGVTAKLEGELKAFLDYIKAEECCEDD